MPIQDGNALKSVECGEEQRQDDGNGQVLGVTIGKPGKRI